MNNSDLCWMSVSDLAAAIARKKVSPIEVVDAVMRRGAKRGALHGVPFSVKDLIITKDVRTTFGTPIHCDNVPTEDAPSVPIGLQIVGRRFDDVTVLRASAAFEAAHPWVQGRPALGAR